MPIRNGEYVTRTEAEVFDTIATALVNEEDDANPRSESTYTNALLVAVARTVAQNQEQSLQSVYNSAYVVDASDEELTKKAQNLGVIRKDAVAATGVVTFSRSSQATQDYSIPSGTVVETVAEDPVQFETERQRVIEGPIDQTDGTLYSTSNTAYTVKTSFDVDPAYRDSLDVSVDLRTTNSSYTAAVEIVDTTNNVTIDTASTTNTTFVGVGLTSYDVSSLEDEITIEYRIKTSDGAGTTEMQNAHVETVGQTGVDATIVGVEGGAETNVGPNSIRAMPSKPTGVEEVTNTEQTGDPSLRDVIGDPLREGRDRESDDELRTRVLNTDAVNEGPSGAGVNLALSEIDGVVSIHVNTNPTGSAQNGLNPYASEVVVYGGDVYEIGSTLYETMSAPTVLRLQGGVNGTKETTTIYSELFDTDITVPITRPVKLQLQSVNVDVVHTGTYNGDVSVKDTVVEYVGGTRADDSTTVSDLGVGDDVLVNEVENRIEDVQGVEYADVTLIDTSGDGTDDTTTDSDGVPIIAVSNSEVARVDADNITLNKTAR